MDRRIRIFDTTLRDGEQAPGCSMNLHGKIAVAEALEGLGVDIIEAGFPVCSVGDFRAVQTIAHRVKNAAVAALARASVRDIDAAAEALLPAHAPRIHVFLATSPVHMQYKLHKTPEQVLAQAAEMTAYARSLCPDVEFSLEDASRSDREFVFRVVEAVIAAGASTVNLPDTVGYAAPAEFAALVRDVRNSVPNIDKACLSAHCHNDLGLAVANSLAAAEAGAGQIECAVNGIGERAGNTALEEFVMNLAVRRDVYHLETGIDISRIYQTSKIVSKASGVRCPPNKAIVGENAFAHEAGIHQHGVMANPETYEIMRPQAIGVPDSSLRKIVLGKHSGRHACEERLEYLGLYPGGSPETLDRLFEEFKALADKKKTVSDRDLEAIAAGRDPEVPQVYTLDRFVINSGSSITSTSAVRLRLADGSFAEKVAIGDGPINASLNAVDKILGNPEIKLEDFSLQVVDTDGTGADAQGECMLRITRGGRSWNGSGVSTDIVESGIKAYLSAVNAMLYDLAWEREEAAKSAGNPAGTGGHG